ncbi:TPA: HNH endonuclease, partial [Mannheimia haemolytica]|nr:HNH endonuclease [Mannheimia haemolytica]
LSRTSIEHYLAQNRTSDSIVHNFGNLCLISPHQNSALSDYETTTKRSFYEGASKRFDCMSLKQAIMLSKENWTEKDIEEHCEDMKKLLDTKPSQNK